MFPRLYEDVTCPLDGYAGYTFRLLANPTGAEKIDWFTGHLGTPGCLECSTEQRCAACTAARSQFARAACSIFGESKVQGFDFSTEAAALASFDQEMPDEFLSWLYMIPAARWAERAEQLKKMVRSPLATNGATS